ncbi:hypothetical protein FDP41_009104 [Naegleria fowleri]|uniref:EF-hand domain-containing protein n=1 Tax=Naegleria fowleri TaxID=5763 RepID=A0A6A5BFQ0_NAEFO|nr:uncharacterized protein FDP41_009104 [Naegleria fowleri]KAF0972855.1 hypothetical protein FDP41_009104 [Naegleria fowleri]
MSLQPKLVVVDDNDSSELDPASSSPPEQQQPVHEEKFHKVLPHKSLNKSLTNRMQIQRFDSLDVIDRFSNIRISPRMLLEKKERSNVEKSILELQEKSRFGKLELANLFSKYSTQIENSGQENGRMTRELFSEALSELLNIDFSEKPEILERYYKIFDSDKSETIDFREFVTGLSVLLKGSFEEKVDFIFSVYDEDGNGFIERHEMIHLLSCLFNKSLLLLGDVRTTLNLPQISNTETSQMIDQADIENIVDKCFGQVKQSGDHSCKISKADFGKWLYNQPSCMQWLSPGISKYYNNDPETGFEIVNDYPIPSLGEYSVLVRNQYVSVNPVDYKIRKGSQSEDNPYVLGVDDIGSKVTKFKIGDEVSGPTFSSGTYQQFVAFHENELAHKPRALDHQVGAANGVIFLTTFQSFQKFHTAKSGEQGSLKGRKVLIIGGSGGTGAAAVLLAKHYFKAELVISIASQKNSSFVKSLGADDVLDYSEGKEQLEKRLKGLNSPGSVFVTIAGALPSQGNSVFGTNNYSFLAMSTDGTTYEQILNWLDKEGLATKIPIAHVVTLENVSQAHKLIETQRTVGKIVLKIPQP